MIVDTIKAHLEKLLSEAEKQEWEEQLGGLRDFWSKRNSIERVILTLVMISFMAALICFLSGAFRRDSVSLVSTPTPAAAEVLSIQVSRVAKHVQVTFDFGTSGEYDKTLAEGTLEELGVPSDTPWTLTVRVLDSREMAKNGPTIAPASEESPWGLNGCALEENDGHYNMVHQIDTAAQWYNSKHTPNRIAWAYLLMSAEYMETGEMPDFQKLWVQAESYANAYKLLATSQ